MKKVQEIIEDEKTALEASFYDNVFIDCHTLEELEATPQINLVSQEIANAGINEYAGLMIGGIAATTVCLYVSYARN